VAAPESRVGVIVKTCRMIGVLAGVAVLGVGPLLTGCRPATHAQTSTQTSAQTSTQQSVQTSASQSTQTSTNSAATTQLAALAIKGRAPMTGYARSNFGPAWPPEHGCDARNNVLRRDLTATTFRGSCTVITGTLTSPYTGAAIHFVRGPQSAAVQIDHVVALGDAWQTGAQSWSASERETFANDPGELLAVDGPSNEQKGDADAASWLPANKSFRCRYVSIQVAVKAKYHLWVTRAEHDAMARVLQGCG
jgi:Protein of unknown function (DUF1524)